LATLGHKNVRRFDVAMDNVLRMRCIKTIGNLDGNVEQPF